MNSFSNLECSILTDGGIDPTDHGTSDVVLLVGITLPNLVIDPSSMNLLLVVVPSNLKLL